MNELEDAYRSFVAEAQSVLAVPGTKAESSLYGPFAELLSAMFSLLGGGDVQIIQQANASEVGIPDYRMQRRGELLGWVEFKAVTGKPIDDLKGHDADQRDRFVNGLHNLILSNGREWRLFQDGRAVGSKIVVGEEADYSQNAILPALTSAALEGLETLIRGFLASSLAPYASAPAAVTALAARAKALKSGLVELGEHNAGISLQSLKGDFQSLLFKNGQKFDWAKFVDSYVQIAAFGALLWRLESHALISLNSQVGLKPGVHPLLYQCLSILWSPASQKPVLEPLLEELCRTVNLIDPQLFAQKPQTGSGRYVPDPIVHAYEPFFSVYDSASRDANGVFYTPVQVVEHIVDGVEELLVNSLGREQGLLDPEAKFLDPATGTGTFLLGLAQAIADAAKSTGLPTDLMVKKVITEHVAAFELFPGPYTIAHQRMESLLQGLGTPPDARLPIYLADTLAAPESGQLGGSGFGVAGGEILKERELADSLKSEEKILVILGNPPYERVRTANGALEPFAQGLLSIMVEATPADMRSDLKSTRDLYVAFWLWSLWALQSVERRLESREFPAIDAKDAHGIVAFITNRTWIAGRSLYGLRSLFRQGAKEIWVHDLGGDARGGAGARSFAGGDANVFDIRTGVAIVWAVFDRGSDAPARVLYRRSYGTRAAKNSIFLAGFKPETFEEVHGERGSVFVPVQWSDENLAHSPQLTQLFSVEAETGILTSRDTSAHSPIGLDRGDVYSASKVRPSDPKPILGGSLGAWAQLAPTRRQAA